MYKRKLILIFSGIFCIFVAAASVFFIFHNEILQRKSITFEVFKMAETFNDEIIKEPLPPQEFSPYVLFCFPVVFLWAGLIFILEASRFKRAGNLFFYSIFLAAGLFFIFVMKVPFPYSSVAYVFCLFGILQIYRIFR